MPHNAPHGVSMVLAGPSGHLWLCLLCLFESISAHAPACPRCSTGLFHGTGRSIQTSMALPSMPCTPCIAFCLAVPKMLFREHLCARFWHRLGLNPAGDPVFRNHAPQFSTALFHGTGRSIYALYALYCLLFSSSEDAISRASLRTLLAPPWA